MRKRKIVGILLMTVGCLVIFAGCGKKNDTEKAAQQEEKTTAETVERKEDQISNTMEVRNNGDAIQWRADRQDSWHDLVKLTELKGEDGQDGQNGKNGIGGTNSKNVEIRKESSYIQWRYVGGSWKNLVALSSLSGSSGENGENVELQTTDSEIQWRYPDGEWKKLVALADITGPTGQNGTDGSDGTDGKTAEFQVNGDILQWRYKGESVWLNLYDLTTLKGADGSDGQDGTDGKDGVNGTNGKDGTNGIDGKTPEIRVDGNTLQWRYTGESNWQDLYDLSALKGADGVNGADGQNGTCSGYFYAQGNSTQLNSTLPFNAQINSGNLVTYNGSQGTITLKQGHVYQVSFSGSIALGATQSNQSFGAAITDGYDNTQSMNSTLIRGNFGQSGGNSDMSIQVPMTYNRLYDATNGDIVLQYTLINYMLVYTKVDSFQYNLTITALN